MTALDGALRATGVEVRYADLVAVRPADLVLAPGDLVAVTGPWERARARCWPRCPAWFRRPRAC